MVVSTDATMASGLQTISFSTISFTTGSAGAEAGADGLVGDGGVGREDGVKEEAFGLKTNAFGFGFIRRQEAAVATRLFNSA